MNLTELKARRDEQKPVERFPIGSKWMVPVTIEATDRCRYKPELMMVGFSNGTAAWVRESDLIAAEAVPTLTAERIETALREIGGCKGYDAGTPDDIGRRGLAVALAEKLGAVAEPKPTISRERVLEMIDTYLCTYQTAEQFADELLNALGAATDAEKGATP
jgi:hypothetical protein